MTTPIQLNILYGCFHATMAELWQKLKGLQSLKFYYLSSNKKCAGPALVHSWTIA